MTIIFVIKDDEVLKKDDGLFIGIPYYSSFNFLLKAEGCEG